MSIHATVVTATVAALLLLSACDPASVADDSYTGVPESLGDLPETAVLDARPLAVWIEEGETFAVTSWGSSSCPSIATSIEATSESVVSIGYEPSPQGTCTADIAPTTHEFSLPAEAVERPLTIRLTYKDTEGVISLTLD